MICSVCMCTHTNIQHMNMYMTTCALTCTDIKHSHIHISNYCMYNEKMQKILYILLTCICDIIMSHMHVSKIYVHSYVNLCTDKHVHMHFC